MMQEDREKSAGTWQRCPWGCGAQLKYTGNLKKDALTRANHLLECPWYVAQRGK